MEGRDEHVENLLLSDSSKRKYTGIRSVAGFPPIWKAIIVTLVLAFVITLGIAIVTSVLLANSHNGDNEKPQEELCTWGKDLEEMTAASKGMFATNRKRFFPKASLSFPPGNVLYMDGKKTENRNDDVTLLFRQYSDFLYLTGVNYPECSLLLDMTHKKCILFAPDPGLYDAVWLGKLETLDDLRKKFDVDEVYWQSNFTTILESLDATAIWTLPWQKFPYNVTTPVNSSTLFTAALYDSRTIKSSQESDLMSAVAQISSASHLDLMKICRPEMYEYQLESRFLYTNYNCGLRQQGYLPIVGSGYNSAILHYSQNTRQMQSGNLVLIDAGAEYLGYGTDITRTFPVDGVWTDHQRQIYQLVLDIQVSDIQMLKPGVVWKSVTNATEEGICTGLKKLGMLQGELDGLLQNNISRIFMPHGLGHFVGLDVHDTYSLPTVLQEGMVVTIEPGIYFNEALLDLAYENPEQSPFLVKEVLDQYRTLGGVRIEDTILITKDSYQVLSDGAPKEIAQIEEAMQHPSS